MENKPKLPFDALTKGYVLVPKSMLECLLKKPRKTTSELEAFFLILTHVNYKEEVYRIKEKMTICPRGESLKSLQTWAKLFGWNRWRVRRFLRKMIEEGLLELIPEEFTTHIRVKEYELWTGNGRKKQTNEEEEACFQCFWKHYHEVTLSSRVNIGRARREWKKLTKEEKEMALEHVEDYYANLKNTAYCKQAASYLTDKTFMDEYEE